MGLNTITQSIERGVQNFMQGLAGNIHKNTRLWLFVPVLIAFILMSGYSQFEAEDDADDLYTSDDSISKKDEKYIFDTWGSPEDQAFVYGVVGGEGNILTKSALLDFLTAYETVATSVAYYSGEAVTWSSVCSTYANGDCDVYSVLQLWDYNRTTLTNDDNVLDTINANINGKGPRGFTAEGEPIQQSTTIGGIETNQDGDILSAKALQMRFILNTNFQEKDGRDKADPPKEEWERKASENVDDLDTSNLDLHTYFGVELGDGISDTFAKDSPLVAVGYFLLIFYAARVLDTSNSVTSYSTMAYWSLIAVALAIGATYAFGLAIGIPWQNQSLILAFLLLGLGIDDTFIIVSSFNTEERRIKTPYERIKSALGQSGTAITVTSMSDCAAFAVGASSKIPVIRYFCSLGAIGIFFDFALQITFVVAALVLTERREAANRYDCLPCVKSKEDPNNRTKRCRSTPYVPNQKGLVQSFFSGSYADFILSPLGRVIIIVVALVVFISSCYSATQVESNFDVEWLVGDDQPIHDAWDIRDDYFGGGKVLPLSFYTKEVDYANLQPELQEFADAVSDFSYLDSCQPGIWVTEFNAWATNNSLGFPVPDFVTNVNTWLDTEGGKTYNDSLLFNSDRTVIVSTVFSCLAKGVSTADKGIDMMDDARSLAGDYSELDAIAYGFPFLFYDGQKEIASEIVLNLILAGVSVFVMTTLLLGNVWGAVLVLMMVVFSDFTVLAFFWYSDLYYNVATAFYIVIAVGLTVDYSAHICHSFLLSHGTGVERAKKALASAGAPVFHGGLTTFLAVLPLAFASSYVFRSQFQALAYVILFGMSYGLIVLPVILSICGPATVEHAEVNLHNTSSKSGVKPQPYLPKDESQQRKSTMI